MAADLGEWRESPLAEPLGGSSSQRDVRPYGLSGSSPCPRPPVRAESSRYTPTSAESVRSRLSISLRTEPPAKMRWTLHAYRRKARAAMREPDATSRSCPRFQSRTPVQGLRRCQAALPAPLRCARPSRHGRLPWERPDATTRTPESPGPNPRASAIEPRRLTASARVVRGWIQPHLALRPLSDPPRSPRSPSLRFRYARTRDLPASAC